MELDKYQKNYIVALSNCNYIIIPPFLLKESQSYHE